MSQTIDQILENEGLIKKDVNKIKARWQRWIEKVSTLTTKRHFNDSRIQVELKGFRVEIIDNTDIHETPVALIGITLSKL
jgi:hypothetical protein